MTEDDTFRVLKRIPFDEMYRLLDIWVNDLKDDTPILTMLSGNGWTLREYNNIAKSRGVSLAAYESDLL